MRRKHGGKEKRYCVGWKEQEKEKKQDVGLQVLCSLLQTMWYCGLMFHELFLYGDTTRTRVLEKSKALYMQEF